MCYMCLMNPMSHRTIASQIQIRVEVQSTQTEILNIEFAVWSVYSYIDCMYYYDLCDLSYRRAKEINEFVAEKK